MDAKSDREQRTHEDVVTQARQDLIEELFLDDTELARAFLELPIGPRVRVGGVRAALAQLAVERVTAADPSLSFGGFLDASDEVEVQLPAQIEVRAGLQVPVRAAV